ncbi:MAG: peptidoglycan-binding protein [Acetobacteraceae bacterium]|nr:peptidoglycan-binding protein [Acetobacteraceae bacterium]
MDWLRLTAAALLFAMPVMPEALAQSTPQLFYSQPVGQAGVATVQQRLKQAGLYGGATDGVWGPESGTALERYQRSNGLAVTGQLNPATVAMLGLNPADLMGPPPAPPAASLAPLAPDVVRTIQTRLRSLGFYGGQIDGIWGPSMQAALERFQQGRGLQATGQLTPATATALGLDPNNLSAPPGPLPAAR